jgi:hypothetical protein
MKAKLQIGFVKDLTWEYDTRKSFVDIIPLEEQSSKTIHCPSTELTFSSITEACFIVFQV